MIFWFLYAPLLCTLTLTTEFYVCSTGSIPHAFEFSRDRPRVIRWIDLIFRRSTPPVTPVAANHDQSDNADALTLVGPSVEWDYMVFVQSWTTAFCYFSKCAHANISHGFNIHGLWPSIWPNQMIGNCSGAPPFNATVLEPIMQQLRLEWADVIKDKPLHFWRHEWSKHGSCAIQSKSIPNQLAYFQTALSLKQAFNATKIFAESGLRPSNRTEYVTESVKQLLRMHVGHEIELNCQWNHGGPASLIELRICLDRNFTVIDCPTFPTQIPLELAREDSLGAMWTAPCPKTFVILEKNC